MLEGAPREHNRRASLDKVAKEGHLNKGDLPGTDTYDDGTDEHGRVVMPGSTSTEAGGNYMEDKGPQDKTRRHKGGDDLASAMEQRGLRIVGREKKAEPEDDAERWLRENDPEYKRRKAA